MGQSRLLLFQELIYVEIAKELSQSQELHHLLAEDVAVQVFKLWDKDLSQSNKCAVTVMAKEL